MVEAGAAVTAEAVVTVDHGRLSRESEVLNVSREEQGAHVTAGALSAAGIHRRHLKGGSAVQRQMKEVHRREAAHPQGIVGRPMGLSTVGVQG